MHSIVHVYWHLRIWSSLKVLEQSWRKATVGAGVGCEADLSVE